MTKETNSLTEVNVSYHFVPDSFLSKADRITSEEKNRPDSICNHTTERSEDFPVSKAVQKAHDELMDHWLNMVIEEEQKLRTLGIQLLNVYLEGCRMDQTANKRRYHSQIQENSVVILERNLGRMKRTIDFRWVNDDMNITGITGPEKKFLTKLKSLENYFEFLEMFIARCKEIFGPEKYWQYPQLYRVTVLDLIREYCHVFGNHEYFPVRMPDYPLPAYVMPIKRRSGYEMYRVQFDDSLFDFLRCGTVQVLPVVSEIDEIERIPKEDTENTHQTGTRRNSPINQDAALALTTHDNYIDKSLEKGSLPLILHIPKPPVTPKSKRSRNLRAVPTMTSNLKSSNQTASTNPLKNSSAADKMSTSPCWPIGMNSVSKFIAKDPRCGVLKFKFRDFLRQSKLPINIAYLMREKINCSSSRRQSLTIREGRMFKTHFLSSTKLRGYNYVQKETRDKDGNSLMNNPRQIAKEKIQRLRNLDPRRRRYNTDSTIGISNIPVRVEYLFLVKPLNGNSKGYAKHHTKSLFNEAYKISAPQPPRVRLPVINNVRSGVKRVTLNTDCDLQRASQRKKLYATSVHRQQNWTLPDIHLPGSKP